MSSKKCVATVLERRFLFPDNYIFLYTNIVTGIYDERLKQFIDEQGNEYYYMMSDNALKSNNPKAIYNVMEIDYLKRKYGTNSIDTILFDYQTDVQIKGYYVGRTDVNTPFVHVFNFDGMRKEASKTAKVISKVETANVEKLEDLILNTVDDEYSQEQIEELLERLYFEQAVMDNTIGTMENKIEAMKENKTYKEYLYEQVEKVELPTAYPKTDEESLKEAIERRYKVPEKKDTSVVVNPMKIGKRINIADVYSKVTKILIAQDEPTRRVITEIARKEMHEKKKKEGILLTGATGVGKTKLMELIAKYTDRPIHKVDSTQITTAGYVGKDIEEELWDLYEDCGRDKEKAEQAIIFFDEIDKKGSEKNDDVNARGVLNELLPFIEGTTYSATKDTKTSSPVVKLNTSNMTVVFAGAFTDVYKGLSKSAIGFDQETITKMRKPEPSDFVNRGMMTDEFMGRVTVIKLNDLDVEDLKRVMLEGDESAIKIQEEIFRKLGVKIRFTDGYINKVAKKAYDKKTGARGLNGIIDESTWEAFEEVYQNPEIFSSVVLTEKTVDDSSKYRVYKKKLKK